MPRKRIPTKTKIIQTAWNLFHKNGYDETTVEDIINASKTSKGTFYHYFKGKEALLNTLSTVFDEKYEELSETIDPDLSSKEKLLYLNRELFSMIEETIDVSLVAYLYSAQLVTKDKRSLVDHKRFYFTWLTELLTEGIERGEFSETSDPEELMEIYAMFERSLLYEWSLKKGRFPLTEYSSKLLPHVLDRFSKGL